MKRQQMLKAIDSSQCNNIDNNASAAADLQLPWLSKSKALQPCSINNQLV
jgi:hypothetical protein